MARRNWILGIGLVVATGVGAFGILWARAWAAPGYWPEQRTRDQIMRGSAKEREWSAQRFTAIEDAESFLEKVRRIPVRVETSLSPDQLSRLQQHVFDQLVCRNLASKEEYRRRFGPSDRSRLDEFERNRIELVAPDALGRELTGNWDAEALFAEFWDAEYDDQDGRRFEDAALGAMGSLIVIGEVRSATPESFFTREEIRRWKAWPGAMLLRSLQFHPGPQSLESIIDRRGTCVYAEVAVIVRSENDEVWSWTSDWYLDPSSEQWHIHVSVSATSRRAYYVPL